MAAGESFEADELWLFIGSKAHPCWLWLCVSFETGQIWAWHVGGRDQKAASALMEQFYERLPEEMAHRLPIYTDGYPCYGPAIEAQLEQREMKTWTSWVHRCRPKKQRFERAKKRKALNAKRKAQGKAPLCDPDLGATNTVEGVNNGLRARCAPLVRRCQAFARSTHWLLLRLQWLIFHKNKRIQIKHTHSDQ